MTFGSVCSGIEAVSVAWLPLGYRAAWLAEIDPFPCAVLAHHYPETPNLGDFTRIDAAPGSIDVLVGGTPCQSFSVAGLRGGLADARGNLALEFLRLAGRARPAWVVWENVPGVLSSNGGRDFGAFLGGLAELGYGWAYRVLDAQHFGVPQRRRRVFVVGHLGDWRRAAAVLFERQSLSGDSPPSRAAGQGTTACLDARPTGGGFPGTDGACGGHVVAHALRGKANLNHREDGDGFDASEDGTGRGTPLVPVAYQCQGNNVGPMGTLRGGNGNEAGGVPFTLAIRGREADSRFEFRQDGVANAILTPNGGRAGIGVGAIAFGAYNHAVGDVMQTVGAQPRATSRPSVMQSAAVRRLTPRECERLQGFPDNWTAVPYRGKPAADGPRYKALGNSMAVPVVRWIGRRILEASA